MLFEITPRASPFTSGPNDQPQHASLGLSMNPVSVRKAEMIQPIPEEVVLARVLSMGQDLNEGMYIIVAGDQGCLAYPVAPSVRVQPSDRVELRGILLEQPSPRRVWEVSIRRGLGVDLLPGQFSGLRTAPAEQWLKEVGLRLNQWIDQERNLVEQRRALSDGQSNAAEPLRSSNQAAEGAQPSGPSMNFQDLDMAAKAADDRLGHAQESLGEHWLAGESIPAWNLPWRISHWYHSIKLHRELKHARTSYDNAQANLAKKQQEAIPSRTVEETPEGVGTKSEGETAVERLHRESKQIAGRILEAQELIEYLECRRGSLVTLEETLAVARRPQTVPRRPVEAEIKPSLTPCHRIRI
jgi:hypothetical protein